MRSRDPEAVKIPMEESRGLILDWKLWQLLERERRSQQ
jgi:hypothetical protein